MDDVSGHQDIIATINKFVEANVSVVEASYSDRTDLSPAIAPFATVWTTRHRKNIDGARPRPQNLRSQEHATDGVGAQCFR